MFGLIVPFLSEVSLCQDDKSIKIKLSDLFEHLYTPAYYCSLHTARWLDRGMGILLCASISYDSSPMDRQPTDPRTIRSIGIQSSDHISSIEPSIEKYANESDVLRTRTTSGSFGWFHSFQSAGTVKTSEKRNALLLV